MDSASRVMRGIAAAGQAVVDEAVKATQPPPAAPAARPPEKLEPPRP
jgi:hypothetical protein